MQGPFKNQKMPWLSRRSSAEGVENSADTSSPTMLSSNTAVTFLPAMLDASCGTLPMIHRQRSVQLVFNGLKSLSQNLRCMLPMARLVWILSMLQSLFKTSIDARYHFASPVSSIAALGASFGNSCVSAASWHSVCSNVLYWHISEYSSFMAPERQPSMSKLSARIPQFR
jgi:hypothetical protein